MSILHNPNFLILAAGGAQPYSVITSILPDLFSPFLAEADDLIIRESGAGVVARLSVEGNAAGFANLRLIGVRFDDARNEPIPAHRLNMARVAVSKDVNGDTVIAGPGEVFRCRGCRYNDGFCRSTATADKGAPALRQAGAM